MGAYDMMTWHADLPELPEGKYPWMINFQTKSIQGRRQRVIEVTREDQLQLREFVGEGFDPTDVSGEMVQRLMERLRVANGRRQAGDTLDPTTYSTQKINHSGAIVFYSPYGDPPNGRLEFHAVFRDGLLQSVQLTKNQEPDQLKWDAHQERTGAMAQFTVQPLTDNPKEPSDD